jgi:hypothetical protein
MQKIYHISQLLCQQSDLWVPKFLIYHNKFPLPGHLTNPHSIYNLALFSGHPRLKISIRDSNSTHTHCSVLSFSTSEGSSSAGYSYSSTSERFSSASKVPSSPGNVSSSTGNIYNLTLFSGHPRLKISIQDSNSTHTHRSVLSVNVMSTSTIARAKVTNPLKTPPCIIRESQHDNTPKTTHFLNYEDNSKINLRLAG